MNQQTIEIEKTEEAVECLGLRFPNDCARRDHFIRLLAKKLGDPKFRNQEGFPIGSDEDILRLSDPPYYTACPNPWLSDFVRHYGCPYDPNQGYHREPFAVDVSEGKNDAFYHLHTYHTKVPYKAVLRQMLHYTEPGHVVLDAFSGTGMVAVAAGLCSNARVLKEMALNVEFDGSVFDAEGQIGFAGPRHAILNDLSPAATAISNGYRLILHGTDFAAEAGEVIEATERDLSILYHVDGRKVASTIWSDVFLCPACGSEIVYWDTAVQDDRLQKRFRCSSCDVIVGKAASDEDGAIKLNRSQETVYDPALNQVVTVPKLIPVRHGFKKANRYRYETVASDWSTELRSYLSTHVWPPVPEAQFFPGRQTNKLINGAGIRFVAHMYTPRALYAYATLWATELSSPEKTACFRFCLSGINNYISRKQGYFGGGGGVAGTLFTPSIHLERNIFDVLRRKVKQVAESVKTSTGSQVFITTHSAADLSSIPDESVDYIFTDPPFGEPLQYAELNFFVEAWTRAFTNHPEDCVLNYVHKKDLHFYSSLMARCFREYARVLKPGRWITVEFHNSENSVWTAIQQALERAGLVVASVCILDKQHRSFNAVNRAGAVDQDLMITCYRPGNSIEQLFEREGGSCGCAWEFVRSHISQLPVAVLNEGRLDIIPDRQAHVLYDRMVAYHVLHNVAPPLSASEFYQGLAERFDCHDGMYFLVEQSPEYLKKRAQASEVAQMSLIVTNEASAIDWLRQQLSVKPQTFQDLQPQFLQEIRGWSKLEKTLDLRDELLPDNFVCYDGNGEVPAQIHRYLSTNYHNLRNLDKDDSALRGAAKDRWYVPDPRKQGDLEKLRERRLLREFEEYLAAKKKVRVPRLEAVRAGFKHAWANGDYKTILEVARKIPEDVLQEDPKLLMYYDQAATRLGVE